MELIVHVFSNSVFILLKRPFPSKRISDIVIGSIHCTCLIITLEVVVVSVDVLGTNNKSERLSPFEYDAFELMLFLLKTIWQWEHKNATDSTLAGRYREHSFINSCLCS